MKTENRYQFEKSPKKKGTCPDCGHANVFRFMYDIETGQRLPDNFGKCDRLDKCKYIMMPTKENYINHFLNKNFNNKTYMKNTSNFAHKPTVSEVIKHIEAITVQTTKKAYNANNFVLWLNTIFESETVNNLLNTYHVGTAKNNGTIFWYMDIENRYRTGKLIEYENNGHRNKEKTPYYIHTKLPKEINEKYELCFYGEHLLNLPENINKTVGIVESEKSAIIASVYLPDYVWLACGGANGNTEIKMQTLKNRKILLFNDLDNGRIEFKKAVDKYKAQKFSINMVDLDVNRNDKTDIADHLIKSKPLVKVITTDIENNIIAHYKSFTCPYNYNEPDDLKSLTSCYNHENNTNIPTETYFNTLVKFNVPLNYMPLPDHEINVLYYFLGFENYLNEVKSGKYEMQTVFNEFKNLFCLDMTIERFQNEVENLQTIDVMLPKYEPLPF
jgi:hypothetical protein